MSVVFRIATRKSPLALWQAQHVAELIKKARPQLQVNLVELSTEGDRFLGAPLSQVGGKGLFVKEIEQALLERRADIAVHSLKDMTSHMPEDLCLACVPEREDPRDAFVSPQGIVWAQLPRGAKVGTSSLRRGCQLKEKRPDIEVVSLRGNVQTRLAKTQDQGLTGTSLALAGLKRLGLEAQVTSVLEPEESLPAVGQGVLAIQCRTDDRALRSLLSKLEHIPTRIAVSAERAFLAMMEGGCSVPLAGYATLNEGKLRVRGLVGRPDGTQVLRAEVIGLASQAEDLGKALAEKLLSHGAGAILKEFAGR